MPNSRSKGSRSANEGVPVVLPIRYEDEIRLIPIRDIWHCARLRNGTVIVGAAGEFRVSKTLDGLEDRLAPQGLFRAHRSYLVNFLQVRSIMTWSRSAYTLRLDCDREVPLSKHRIGALRRTLDW